MEHRGIPFPKDQPMGVYSSIWNADDWATQGGRVKTDWSHAPFIATYKAFEINACECPVTVTAVDNAKRCSSGEDRKYWWDEPNLSELSLHQSHQLMWVRANHMVYDYCADTSRFPVTPAECVHHRHQWPLPSVFNYLHLNRVGWGENGEWSYGTCPLCFRL